MKTKFVQLISELSWKNDLRGEVFFLILLFHSVRKCGITIFFKIIFIHLTYTEFNMAKLYLVSIHIGNPEDITLRALKILKSINTLICEDYKIGKRIIKEYSLGEKELIRINVKSSEEDIDEIITQYLLKGKDIALFSDAGTPVFADPGFRLSQKAYNLGIEVVPIPGASSLMAAIVKSDIEMKRFYYYGFLSAKKEIRKKELQKLKDFSDPIVFLEAPYRLLPLLDALKKHLPNRYINVICELTTSNEKLIKGTTAKVYEYFKNNPFKGEFIIITEGKKRNIYKR